MILIRCPYCGELRTEEELRYGGEPAPRAARPQDVADEVWTDYLFMRSNPKGLLVEQWCCLSGCGQWFAVWRESVTHEIGAVTRLEPAEAPR